MKNIIKFSLLITTILFTNDYSFCSTKIHKMEKSQLSEMEKPLQLPQNISTADSILKIAADIQKKDKQWYELHDLIDKSYTDNDFAYRVAYELFNSCGQFPQIENKYMLYVTFCNKENTCEKLLHDLFFPEMDSNASVEVRFLLQRIQAYINNAINSFYIKKTALRKAQYEDIKKEIKDIQAKIDSQKSNKNIRINELLDSYRRSYISTTLTDEERKVSQLIFSLLRTLILAQSLLEDIAKINKNMIDVFGKSQELLKEQEEIAKEKMDIDKELNSNMFDKVEKINYQRNISLSYIRKDDYLRKCDSTTQQPAFQQLQNLSKQCEYLTNCFKTFMKDYFTEYFGIFWNKLHNKDTCIMDEFWICHDRFDNEAKETIYDLIRKSTYLWNGDSNIGFSCYIQIYNLINHIIIEIQDRYIANYITQLAQQIKEIDCYQQYVKEKYNNVYDQIKNKITKIKQEEDDAFKLYAQKIRDSNKVIEPEVANQKKDEIHNKYINEIKKVYFDLMKKNILFSMPSEKLKNLMNNITINEKTFKEFSLENLKKQRKLPAFQGLIDNIHFAITGEQCIGNLETDSEDD